MKLRALVFVLVMAPSSPAMPLDDQAAVADVLVAYRAGLIEGDGISVSGLTSTESHRLLRDSLDPASHMTREELKALPALQQVAILLLRHSIDAAHLRGMTGSDAVAYAVEERVFDARHLANAAIDEIYVEGDEAQAFLLRADGIPDDAAIFLRKEAGAWHIDLKGYLAQYVPHGIIYNPETVSDTTDIEGRMMLSTVAWISGRAPDANIWDPPG